MAEQEKPGVERAWTMDDVDHLVELRGVYDGWSYAILKSGEAVNRWNPDDYPTRFTMTQGVVDEYNAARLSVD